MNSEERAKALERAYSLLETPRSHLRVKFEQTEGSVLLSYRGDVLTGVDLDESGINAASAMAVALGVGIPAENSAVEVLASTGHLYRVLNISDLDFTNPTTFELANHLVNEAVDMQRGTRTHASSVPRRPEDLQSGENFGPYPILLTQPEADAYTAATGNSVDCSGFGGNAHPLQLDAYVLSELISELGIVENQIETLHAGQQMTVHRRVSPGETIIANATLKSCSNRRGSIWAIFVTAFVDESGRLVGESSSTIIMMP